jgi:hypothetical protein
MTQFSKDTILFRFVPDSKVELPRSANEAKLYLDSSGRVKVLYFNGETVELGSEQTVTNNITNETIVAYDDSTLKEQLVALSDSLKTFATTEELAKDIAIVLKTLDKNKNDTLREYLQYAEDLNRFIRKTEAALAATDVAATQARADVQAAQEQLDQLRGIVSSIATSLSRLSGDFANSFKLFNSALNLKADKATVNSQMANMLTKDSIIDCGEVI